MFRPLLGPCKSSFERLTQFWHALGSESSGQLRGAPRSSGEVRRAWVGFSEALRDSSGGTGGSSAEGLQRFQQDAADPSSFE
eukprot:11342526-Alexandrium_andersonii.AAC.1